MVFISEKKNCKMLCIGLNLFDKSLNYRLRKKMLERKVIAVFTVSFDRNSIYLL